MREFEILSVLGGGKTSLVYKAYDQMLAQLAVIKEYLPAGYAFRLDPTLPVEILPGKEEAFRRGLDRFFAEAQNMTRFCHLVLRDVRHMFQLNGSAYIVMQYHEGKTLREMVRLGWRIKDMGSLLSIMLPLLTGISCLHRAGCYHCDISPDNVLMRPDHSIILLDFGAMRRLGETAEDPALNELAPGFAAKEQYEEGGALSVGAWTDIYAASALIYYLVTGIIPDASFSRITHDFVQPLTNFATPELPADVLSVIDRGFAPDPLARFGSTDLFVQALDIAVKDAAHKSDKRIVRDLLAIDTTAASFSSEQRQLLQSILGLREHQMSGSL